MEREELGEELVPYSVTASLVQCPLLASPQHLGWLLVQTTSTAHLELPAVDQAIDGVLQALLARNDDAALRVCFHEHADGRESPDQPCLSTDGLTRALHALGLPHHTDDFGSQSEDGFRVAAEQTMLDSSSDEMLDFEGFKAKFKESASQLETLLPWAVAGSSAIQRQGLKERTALQAELLQREDEQFSDGCLVTKAGHMNVRLSVAESKLKLAHMAVERSTLEIDALWRERAQLEARIERVGAFTLQQETLLRTMSGAVFQRRKMLLMVQGAGRRALRSGPYEPNAY